MNELIKPRLELEKEKALENTRKEATETAILQVKAKIKEQLEAEQAAREAAEGKDVDLSAHRTFVLCRMVSDVSRKFQYQRFCFGEKLTAKSKVKLTAGLKKILSPTWHDVWVF